MKTEIIIPTSELSAFVSSYFLIQTENDQNAVRIQPFESEISLGLPLGKPFFYYAGPSHGEFEEVPFDPFDKPLMFWDSKYIDYLCIKGYARAVFVKFTSLGLEVFLHEKNPKYQEAVFPLNVVGVPAFGLAVKRRLRFNQDNYSGIGIIEEELLRFYQKDQKYKSEPDEMDFDKEFPFLA